MSRHASESLSNEKCRQCSSFSSYYKKNKKKFEEGDNGKVCSADENDTLDLPMPSDCPLDRESLGNRTWSFLHTMAAKYPEKPTCEQKQDMVQFLNLLGKFYPCEECAADYREEIQKHPPKVKSQDALSQWLCQIHNRISERIGKEPFDCSLVNERWRDGWKDGSCDL